MSDPLFELNRDCSCGGHFEPADLTGALADVRDLADGSEPDTFWTLVAAARRWLSLTSDENIEAAARAFYELDDCYRDSWESQPENGVKVWYQEMARAALQAVKTT